MSSKLPEKLPEGRWHWQQILGITNGEPANACGEHMRNNQT